MAGAMAFAALANEAATNPLLGDSDAIQTGKRLYRQLCYICHLKSGGRGPNLFRTALSHEKFLDTVLNGRDNTQMPAFRERLKTGDIWRLHAYLMSRDHY